MIRQAHRVVPSSMHLEHLSRIDVVVKPVGALQAKILFPSVLQASSESSLHRPSERFADQAAVSAGRTSVCSTIITAPHQTPHRSLSPRHGPLSTAATSRRRPRELLIPTRRRMLAKVCAPCPSRVRSDCPSPLYFPLYVVPSSSVGHLECGVVIFAPPLRDSRSSRRTVQGCRERTDHEAELLQDHRIQALPGRHTVSAQGARVENGRSSRASSALRMSATRHLRYLV